MSEMSDHLGNMSDPLGNVSDHEHVTLTTAGHAIVHTLNRLVSTAAAAMTHAGDTHGGVDDIIMDHPAGTYSAAGGHGHGIHHAPTGRPAGMPHEPAGGHGGMPHQPTAGSHGGGHSQYFVSGTNTIILFKGLETRYIGDLIGAMVAVFVFAMLFEGIRTLREVMAHGASVRALSRVTRSTKSSVVSMTTYRWSLKDTVLQTLLHMLFFTWSYFLMLIFMTYNVWLCLSVVLGVGSGYIAFLRFRPPFSQAVGTNGIAAEAYHPAEDECCV